MTTQTGIVAAPHALAAEIGAEILADGGNAFDAAVSVALAIGVTQPYHSGIGGGCNSTYHTADGEIGHINARGPAPQGLQRDLLLDRSGAPDYARVQAGGLASTVPSFVAGLTALHRDRGRLPWSDLCLAPQRLALEGFGADFLLASMAMLPATVAKLESFGGDSVLAGPISVGQPIVQPQMGETLAAIAADPQSVYSGAIASSLAAAVTRFGGVLSTADLAAYAPESTPVNRVHYRDWEICAPGLPTIGALQTLLTLQILAHFDLKQYTPGSPQQLHLVAEAVRATYAARAEIGGPQDAPQFLSEGTAAHFAAQIRMDRTHPSAFLTTPVRTDAQDDRSCTSHFCVADGEGNIVSQTQTVRSYFGSGVIDPVTGIVLNDSVGDFSLQPGETTTQGIRYQGDYNLVAPGAEPASSQSPLLAIHAQSGDMIAAGAAGGPRIVSATVQALVNQIDYGMDPRLAAAFPRVHAHGPITDIEPNCAAGPALAALGHSLQQLSRIGMMQTIRRRQGLWQGGADPRGPGAAAIVERTGDGASIQSHGSFVWEIRR